MRTVLELKCPSCNGVLNVDPGLEQAYCTYCGAKVLISDENKKTYHYINEAEVQKVKSEEVIRKAEIEEEGKSEKRAAILGGLCLLIALLILGMMHIPYLFENVSISEENRVKVTMSSSDFKKLDYQEAEKKLRDLGFTDISCMPRYDLQIGLFHHSGEIDSISINGSESFEEGKVFSKTAPVNIIFHDFESNKESNTESNTESGTEPNTELNTESNTESNKNDDK